MATNRLDLSCVINASIVSSDWSAIDVCVIKKGFLFSASLCEKNLGIMTRLGFKEEDVSGLLIEVENCLMRHPGIFEEAICSSVPLLPEAQRTETQRIKL